VQASGPDFLNAVVVLESSLAAAELLVVLQGIEARHGRLRPYRNAPRTLDLDLLFFGECVLNTPELTLPHPRLHLRAFVLEPLLSLWPSLSLPGLGALSTHCNGLSGQVLQALAAHAVPEWPQQALAPDVELGRV
jgi:2-amino-4-hydroxy-6-hydroxymethyldihydropteridine diphosphokinase